MTRLIIAAFLCSALSSICHAQGIPAPVACYNFNGTANDGSGNAHHGTVFGAMLTSDRSGNSNAAYAFNGVSDYIEVPSFETFGIQAEVTVGFWAQANTNQANFAVSVWPDNFNDRFVAAPHYGHNGGGSIFWDFGNAAADGRTTVIPYTLFTQWAHWTFTSSAANNRMRVYLNGNLVHQVTQHSTMTDLQRVLTLGGGNILGYNHWDGKLDDIVLYNTELSSSEVAGLYTNGAACSLTVGTQEVSNEQPSLWVDQSTGTWHITVQERAVLVVLDATGRRISSSLLNAGVTAWSDAAMPAGAYIACIYHGQYVRKVKVVVP